jgi:quinol monooxygenase YgiN
MYAMYEKLTSHPGKRSEFAAILTRAAEVVGQLPGCRLYIVHEDPADETTITVYEAWDDKAAHDASLQEARVRALIAEAMPLMGGPPAGVELRVVGGHGLGDADETPH